MKETTMTYRYATFTAGIAALVIGVGLLGQGEASAASVDFDTHITFKEPVRIPGATLPAGDYVFQRDENNHAVWVLSETDDAVFGPYLIRPRTRVQASPERLVILERPATAGTPRTLRAWLGEHKRLGYELVYPTDGYR